MLYVFYGSDRVKAHGAAFAAMKKREDRLVITDAHTLSDMEMAMRGGGLFVRERSVLFDSVLGNEEMRQRLLEMLPQLAASSDLFVILEGALDAVTKKSFAKHAGKIEQFDAQKESKQDDAIFALANALRKGDKKALWVGLMREYAKGKPPEAIHGLLFWGAKDMMLKARDARNASRARSLVTYLADLPHRARREGMDLEYALEAFALSGM